MDQPQETRPTDGSRPRVLVRELAVRAAATARDGATTRPRAGTRRYELMRAVPAARRLLTMDAGPLERPPTDPAVEVTDGAGQRRPVYRYLAWRLHGRASGEPMPELPPADGGVGSVDLKLWALLHDHGAARSAKPTADRVRRIVPDTAAGSLQVEDPDEAPDHWTFRELAGLHALHALARATGDAWCRRRVASAAAFHLVHTQPDYTTYQPWGMAAFLSRPETASFGEQQLHDVATHLAVAGGPGAVVPALLLADAYASLDASPQAAG